MAIALSQLLANLAPVVVSYRSPDDLVAAAVFGTTFVLARIPLFLFAPVQAVLLPKLTRAATLGRRDELVRRLRQALALVSGLGRARGWSAACCSGRGRRRCCSTPRAARRRSPWGCSARPRADDAALVVQPTLVALGRQRLVTAAWVLGAVVFLACWWRRWRRSPPRWPPSWSGPAVVLAVLGDRCAPGTAGTGDGRLTADRASGPAADAEGS